MSNSTIRAFDVTTRRPIRLGVDTVSLRDLGNWTGIRFEQWSLQPKEIEEHYFNSHAVFFHLRSAPCEIRFNRGTWKSAPLHPGAVHLAPAGMPCAARWRDINEVLCLTVDPELLGSVMHDRRIDLQPAVNDDPLIGQMMQALAEDIRSGCPFGPLYGESLCTGLVAHLACKYGGHKPFHAGPSLSSYDVRRVLEYVDANLDRVVTLQELADLIPMNKFHFLRAFSSEVGVPPYRYFLARRLERAKSLLRESEYPLCEIALRSGFSSHSHFTSAFTSHVGISPGTFRSIVNPAEAATRKSR